VNDVADRAIAEGLRVNLGCGNNRVAGFIGVDIGDGAAVVVRMDELSYLRSLPDASVQEVYSRHFLEHVEPPALRPLLLEIDRVLQPGGKARFIVPHFSNPYFYSDPTHRTFFGVHTFSYLCEHSCLNRHVPNYAAIPRWSLVDVRAGFEPYARPRLLGIRIPMLSGLLKRIVNVHTLALELFERYLSGLWSIYEVDFRIEKLRAPQPATRRPVDE
jgi:hypothetical protein